ncbi:MAG: hypothetical protein ACI978_002287 [Oleispira sp.]|jgi:hypothetical protein
MKKVFISYKHSDRQYVDQIKSVVGNPNHSLEFDDHSLAEAVLNMHGHINRRPPSSFESLPVKNEIEKRLKQSDKLVAIIGDDTHSSEWVKWEIDTFEKHRGARNILIMRPQNSTGKLPLKYSRYSIESWNLQHLNNWLER